MDENRRMIAVPSLGIDGLGRVLFANLFWSSLDDDSACTNREYLILATR